MSFIEKKLRMCLTEYRHSEYDELVKSYNKFLTVSQFDSAPNWVGEDDPRLIAEPKCGYGEVMYGVNEHGNLFKLLSIIDSSD